MTSSLAESLDAFVRDPGFLERYPYYVAVLAQLTPVADPSIARMGYTPIAGIALYCKFFNDLGLTSSLVPARDIVTNQFVAYANDFDKKAWITEVKRMR